MTERKIKKEKKLNRNVFQDKLKLALVRLEGQDHFLDVVILPVKKYIFAARNFLF